MYKFVFLKLFFESNHSNFCQKLGSISFTLVFFSIEYLISLYLRKKKYYRIDLSLHTSYTRISNIIRDDSTMQVQKTRLQNSVLQLWSFKFSCQKGFTQNWGLLDQIKSCFGFPEWIWLKKHLYCPFFRSSLIFFVFCFFDSAHKNDYTPAWFKIPFFFQFEF